MPRYEMPDDISEKSEYANKEPEYENKSIMLTDEGKKVIILNYQKEKGLYAVINVYEPGVHSPAYRISPDKLRKIEEEKSEHIPTSEEVLALFEKLVGEAKYEEVRKLEDEKGLYLWDIKIVQEDGSVEYSYIRKGNYKEKRIAGGSPLETAIHITYFDNEGIPISGHSVVKFIDGKWKDTP